MPVTTHRAALIGLDGRAYADQRLADLLAGSPFSVEPAFGNPPPETEGFVVHLAGMERTLPATATADEIRRQILFNRNEAQRHSAYASGGVDPEGKYVFDVFRIIESCREAIKLARDNEQDSIYDIESGEELFLEAR